MRRDLYTGIHKALRRELMLLTIEAGTVDPNDSVAVRTLAVGLSVLMSSLDEHAKHEERFIHPALTRANPDLAKSLEEAHREIEEQFTKLSQDLSSEQADRQAQGLRQFSGVVSAYLGHMQEEEEFAMAALWAAYTDEELDAIQRSIIGSISPAAMKRNLVMMMPAMNPAERFGLLAGIRAGAPPEVFQALWSVSRAVLCEADGQALEKRLGLAA